MPITVNLPDGRKINFPDGMPVEQVQAEMQKLAPPPSAPPAAATAGMLPQSTPADVAPKPKPSLVDRGVDALPMLGGIAGGITGGIGGTVAGVGVGGAPGAIGGATLGGSAGEALRQLVNRARGRETPATAGQAAASIGKEGLIQGASEAGGRVLAGGARVIGKSLVENAVRPTMTMVKEFPDVVGTIVRERLPVGRALPGATPGSTQAKRLLQASSQHTRELLKGAEQAGIRFNPQQIAAQNISDLAGEIRKQPLSGPDLKRLSAMTMQYIKEHGAAMTPQAVKDMKQAAQALAKPVFRAQQAGGAVTADQALGARFNEAIASGAKQALETISGIAASEGRTQGLIGATRAIRQAETRRLSLAGEAISGSSAIVAGLLSSRDLPESLQRGVTAWLVVRGLASPRTISREGLALTSAQAQQLFRQFPRLGVEVVRRLQAGGAGSQQSGTAAP